VLDDKVEEKVGTNSAASAEKLYFAKFVMLEPPQKVEVFAGIVPGIAEDGFFAQPVFDTSTLTESLLRGSL
jgi:hypothetical protein